MDSWFNTPERVQRLNEAAQTWLGTPFAANSRCKGKQGGVSCQMLAEQVYKESGVPFSFLVPSGSMRWAGVSSDSLIVQFLETHPELIALVSDPSPEVVQAGDLLGFKIGKCVHHVGVALSEDKFIHCMRGSSALICSLSDPTYKHRLACIWRIKP